METPALAARKDLAREKCSAAWLSMMDLGTWLDFSEISRTYFGKSNNWILQRLHGYEMHGEKAEFKEEEYKVLTVAYKEIAQKLREAADMIEAAK